MTAPARFRASPDALATRVGDEIVLVHVGTDQIYVLNRTGARVWELLTADVDRARLTDRLLDEFDAPRAELTTEVDALIRSLLEGRLLTPHEDG